ncbi:MAG: AtpZ/AtpI family protein [Phycisphaerales bacterium]|jgi:F0F1-type ATP synthase assembly protein I|nr:AtpZ/AtpI family protein [Phycisphaerales bacterium]
MPPDPTQSPSDEPTEPGHHFTPDIPTPPPPPPVPDLLARPVERRAVAPPANSTGLGDTARAWGIAMDFVVTVIGMALLGYFADRYFKASPIWTIVGLSTGFAFALYKIIRRTLADEKREAAERAASQDQRATDSRSRGS